MIANYLMLLGVKMADPGNFYQPDEWNEKGYYEPEDIIDINSRMITGFSRCRSRLSCQISKILYMTLPPAWWIHVRAFLFKKEIQQLSTKYRGLAVKDPRFCLTLPVWSRYAKIEMVIVCLRNPESSINSLKRRQGLPLQFGYLFWRYHIRALLQFIRGYKDNVLVIDFNKLMSVDNLPVLQEIRDKLMIDMSVNEMQQVFLDVFDKNLVRSQAKMQSVPRNVEQLWDDICAINQKKAPRNAEHILR